MMDSGLIGKIEKAKHYAEAKDRISMTKIEAKFRGENNDHFPKHFYQFLVNIEQLRSSQLRQLL